MFEEMNPEEENEKEFIHHMLEELITFVGAKSKSKLLQTEDVILINTILTNLILNSIDFYSTAIPEAFCANIMIFMAHFSAATVRVNNKIYNKREVCNDH